MVLKRKKKMTKNERELIESKSRISAFNEILSIIDNYEMFDNTIKNNQSVQAIRNATNVKIKLERSKIVHKTKKNKQED